MNPPSVPGTLYAAHQRSEGAPVRACFVGEDLIVDRFDGVERAQIPAAALTVTAGGFDHDLLCLGWTTGDGVRYSLQLTDTAASAQLLAGAPASLSPVWQRWRARARRQWRSWQAVGAAALAFVLTLTLVLALAWWHDDRLIDWIARKVPPETEAVLGEMTMAQLRASSTMIEKGPAVEVLKTLGDRLTAGSRYHYRWAIQDDPTINAFALPGGLVVVHRGLIDAAKSADELAGVLAHEVQHIEQRHSLKDMIHSLGWATALSIVLGDISAATGALAYEAGQLRYSRGLETEADRLGVQALVAAEIDPAGMATFFRTLANEKAETIALLSSHPATDERLAAIEADISALPKHDYPPLSVDWPALQEAARRGDGTSD